MKPVVILDANVLHGRKPFTRAHSALILNLARTCRIRLVVPEVVLHELSRQWAEHLEIHRTALGKALDEINNALVDVGAAEVAAETPAIGRVVFYDHAVALLHSKGVEIAPCPNVPTRDLLARDLNARKPFSREGRGFRDTLIWETIRAICNESKSAGFVTNNTRDFCDEQGRDLHADLREEIPAGQPFEVVRLLKDLVVHSAIEPLAALLHVEDSLTPRQVANFVDRALSDLSGHTLDETVGSYDKDGIYTNPISTLLDDVAFNSVEPDDGTIEFEIFRTGEGDEMTIRVTVEGDCDVEGFILKSDFLVHEGAFSYFEDWNRHVMRVIEPHRLRFTLNAEFMASEIEGLSLAVDEVEDVR